MIIDESTLSLEDRVYYTLEEEILTGKLKRGEQLKEMALAKRLDASRTPVRAALHRLTEDGLVEQCVNKGATVVGITTEDIEDIYAIRMRLEGLAARLAAERMSEEEKAELTTLVELSEFYLSKSNSDKSGEIDSAFHKMIFEACGSRYLCKILSDLHKNITLYRKASLKTFGRAEKSVLEHREILEAIIKGDGDAAERLTHVHIKSALDNILALK